MRSGCGRPNKTNFGRISWFSIFHSSGLHQNVSINWWNGFTRRIDEFVEKCSNYQQVKAEYQTLEGFTQDIAIPTL